MNKQFGNDDPRMADYIARVYQPEDDLLREVRTRVAAAGMPGIHVAALDGRHLEVLARACGARRAVEVGTLGGYSGICLLRGMQPDGVLHTIEIDPHHADVAAETFRRAGVPVGKRVHIHLGAGKDVLPTLDPHGPFDLVFIDADKENYPVYLGWAAKNLRSGGIVLGDNSFLFGHLPDEPKGEDAAAIKAMRAFHDTLANSGLFRSTVIPTGEGLALGVRV
ncbi:MAG TPA: O-methyltransferase [Polyangia bacterium]|jgi:caffeoyl-CoA O-methyltransferase|nr:O-methyltransferase [Polyangia bacterium]